MKKILVPTDLSNRTDRAVDLAVEFALAHDAEILLLNVHEPSLAVAGPYPVVLPDVDRRTREGVEASLELAREQVEKAGAEADSKLVRGPTVDSILDVIEEENVDHVVMSTRGASGLERLLLGSVSEKTARLAPVPVTVVPSGAE